MDPSICNWNGLPSRTDNSGFEPDRLFYFPEVLSYFFHQNSTFSVLFSAWFDFIPATNCP